MDGSGMPEPDMIKDCRGISKPDVLLWNGKGWASVTGESERTTGSLKERGARIKCLGLKRWALVVEIPTAWGWLVMDCAHPSGKETLQRTLWRIGCTTICVISKESVNIRKDKEGVKKSMLTFLFWGFAHLVAPCWQMDWFRGRPSKHCFHGRGSPIEARGPKYWHYWLPFKRRNPSFQGPVGDSFSSPKWKEQRGQTSRLKHKAMLHQKFKVSRRLWRFCFGGGNIVMVGKVSPNDEDTTSSGRTMAAALRWVSKGILHVTPSIS